MVVAKGKSLKIARIKCGLLQRDIAHDVGITTNSYSCIENHLRSTRAPVAKRICDTLRSGFDDLFEIVEEARK